MLFNYEGHDKNSARFQGKVEAKTLEEASMILRNHDIFAVELTEGLIRGILDGAKQRDFLTEAPKEKPLMTLRPEKAADPFLETLGLAIVATPTPKRVDSAPIPVEAVINELEKAQNTVDFCAAPKTPEAAWEKSLKVELECWVPVMTSVAVWGNKNGFKPEELVPVSLNALQLIIDRAIVKRAGEVSDIEFEKWRRKEYYKTANKIEKTTVKLEDKIKKSKKVKTKKK